MTRTIIASRYHDISAGHRVHGHESKCALLHGHNYRVHLDCEGELDALGRVIDFAVIKHKLCAWLEEQWDHRFILWERDPMSFALRELDPAGVVLVPFNPTAENMAQHLVEVVGPAVFAGTGVTLVSCKVDETRKCSARFSL